MRRGFENAGVFTQIERNKMVVGTKTSLVQHASQRGYVRPRETLHKKRLVAQRGIIFLCGAPPVYVEAPFRTSLSCKGFCRCVIVANVEYFIGHTTMSTPPFPPTVAGTS